jgi:hypothetical protein
MNEVALYDRMCSAIAECHRVDEVLDIRSKAQALAMYAKQAKNLDAERRAIDIRLRAERRSGELLRELHRATPQTANPSGNPTASVAGGVAPTPYRSALDDAQIPERTAQRYQALAAVPQDVFEAALRDPDDKPTTNGILSKHEATKAVQRAADAADPVIAHRMPSDALWFWGRLRDFERDGYLSKDIGSLLEPMTPSMRADVLRILPLMTDFFSAANEKCHEYV